MGTSVIQDNAKFANVMANFKVHSTAAANGALVFAGTHWPLGVADVNAVGATSVGRQMRREIDYAFAEARAMLAAGFVKAAAACQGEEARAKCRNGARLTGAARPTTAAASASGRENYRASCDRS